MDRVTFYFITAFITPDFVNQYLFHYHTANA